MGANPSASATKKESSEPQRRSETKPKDPMPRLNVGTSIVFPPDDNQDCEKEEQEVRDEILRKGQLPGSERGFRFSTQKRHGGFYRIRTQADQWAHPPSADVIVGCDRTILNLLAVGDTEEV
uniref:Uncharacterized protein n=1 Tax=Lotharella oceanica TaxID=641309 RepID=A0A7S2TR63_9EUKA